MALPDDEEQNVEIERRFTRAFHRSVLARYKCSLDLYEVSEVECEGLVRRRDVDDATVASDEHQYFEIHYGYRHLVDGRVCVIALLFDFDKLPERERAAWRADIIESPQFAQHDPVYASWKARAIQGLWTETGSLERLRLSIRELRAITLGSVNIALFKVESNPQLHFPIAENTAELHASRVELYKLVVENLDDDCLLAIVALKGVNLKDPQKGHTLNHLEEFIPSKQRESVMKPLRELGRQRQLVHSASEKVPTSAAAFDDFVGQLGRVADSIAELVPLFEQILDVDLDRSVRRMEIMESRMFPKVVTAPGGHPEADKVSAIVGLTVTGARIGVVQTAAAFDFKRDGMELSLSDGSLLFVTTMPMVGNLPDNIQDMVSRELHVHIDLDHVPNARKISSRVEQAGWSASRPTRPGWYFWRESQPGAESRVVKVCDVDAPLGTSASKVNETEGGEWWSAPISEPPTNPAG